MAGRNLLALFAAAVAAVPASAAEPAIWRGHTTQGFVARAMLSPSGGLVTLLRAQYELACDDDSSAVRRLVLSRAAGDTIVVKDGRFATSGTVASGLNGKGSGSATYRVSGRVRANRITGVLRVDYALDSGVRCTTELVGFVLR
jgi:hypothetical protein